MRDPRRTAFSIFPVRLQQKINHMQLMTHIHAETHDVSECSILEYTRGICMDLFHKRQIFILIKHIV